MLGVFKTRGTETGCYLPFVFTKLLGEKKIPPRFQDYHIDFGFQHMPRICDFARS